MEKPIHGKEKNPHDSGSARQGDGEVVAVLRPWLEAQTAYRDASDRYNARLREIEEERKRNDWSGKMDGYYRTLEETKQKALRASHDLYEPVRDLLARLSATPPQPTTEPGATRKSVRESLIAAGFGRTGYTEAEAGNAYAETWKGSLGSATLVWIGEQAAATAGEIGEITRAAERMAEKTGGTFEADPEKVASFPTAGEVCETCGGEKVVRLAAVGKLIDCPDCTGKRPAPAAPDDAVERLANIIRDALDGKLSCNEAALAALQAAPSAERVAIIEEVAQFIRSNEVYYTDQPMSDRPTTTHVLKVTTRRGLAYTLLRALAGSAEEAGT